MRISCLAWLIVLLIPAVAQDSATAPDALRAALLITADLDALRGCRSEISPAFEYHRKDQP